MNRYGISIMLYAALDNMERGVGTNGFHRFVITNQLPTIFNTFGFVRVKLLGL